MKKKRVINGVFSIEGAKGNRPFYRKMNDGNSPIVVSDTVFQGIMNKNAETVIKELGLDPSGNVFKTVATLENTKSVDALTCLGMCASKDVAVEAVAALERLKALVTLKELGLYTNVGKEVVAALERLRAKNELEYIGKEVFSVSQKEEAVAALERLNAVDELKHLGRISSHEGAVDALERMLPAFIEKGDTYSLLFLAEYGSDNVDKKAIAALERLNAVDELRQFISYCHGKEDITREAVAALERLKED